MFRRIATFVLLVPLSLNGLWMVCAEPPEEAATTTPPAEPSEHCKKMCPLHQGKVDTELAAVDTDSDMQPGAICLISSDGSGASISAFAFAVAPPPAAMVTIAADLTDRTFATDKPIFYGDPPLSGSTPPPKA
jgi:hypothetical protein